MRVSGLQLHSRSLIERMGAPYMLRRAHSLLRDAGGCDLALHESIYGPPRDFLSQLRESAFREPIYRRAAVVSDGRRLYPYHMFPRLALSAGEVCL
jgi:hypothetical protein